MRVILVLLVGAPGLSACNTVEGVGRDIQGAGDAVEESARKVKRAITE